eukprot:SAG22_NODE_9481_length_587_cov_1.485656_2_plen_141_part_01
MAGIDHDQAIGVHIKCAALVSSPTSVDLNAETERNQRSWIYQTLRPSVTVANVIAPLQTIFQENYMIGVHVRQGDNFDQQQNYFFGNQNPEHSDAFVLGFVEVMKKYPPYAKDGKPVMFFLAADQVAARLLMRKYIGARLV